MRHLISLLFLVLSICAYGHQITLDEAQAAAQDFFNNIAFKQTSVPRVKQVLDLNIESAKGASPYYVFNASDNKGFVIISGDDRAGKILGYSDSGCFDSTNIPPQLAAMLGSFAESLSYLKESVPDQSWTNPTHASVQKNGVLLETANWGQGFPYNLYCPIIDGVQTTTGCVATAMAIVMKYHNWPSKGHHKWEYTLNSITHSIDFSQSNYTFDQYQNSYTQNVDVSEPVANLAKLMYDCGVAASTYYNQAASSARSDIIGHIMTRFFHYSSTCQHLLKKHFNETEWTQLIKNNINQNNPVIYFGTSDEEGHAFVIDGYKDDMFHVNWGWDSALNGYFALSSFTPGHYNFSKDHSMVVNIFPDYDNNEYSELWCNIGLFNELNSEYESEDEQNGRGMEISCSDIVAGKPFTMITDCLSGPKNFKGEIALCVADSDNNIKEILATKQVREALFPGESFPYYNLNESKIWKDVVYNGLVSDDYQLRLFAKRDDGQDWLLVNWTDQTPCYLPLKENIPTVVDANINLHCNEEEYDNISYKINPFRTGQAANLDIFCSKGIAHVFFDSKYMVTATAFKSAQAAHYRPKNLEMDVDIYYSSYENLEKRVIQVTSPGTLYDNFLPIDTLNLYNLTIKGEINSQDLRSLKHLHGLGILDLSEASVPSGSLSEGLPPLQILKLPDNLLEVGNSYSVPYHYETAMLMNVPSSVRHLGKLLGKPFIKFDGSTPPTVSDELSNDPSFNKINILFVPKGAKEAYQSDPVWGKAMYIEECDEPMNASLNLPYINITDSFCGIIDGRDFSDAGVIPFPPTSYTPEYERYPGRFFDVPSEVYYDGMCRQVRFIKDIGLYNNKGSFNGREIYILPSDGFFKGFSYNEYYPLYPMQYIITPRLTANFTGLEGMVLVPDLSTVGDDDRDTKNNFYERYIMFKLYKNESRNLLSVVPNIEGITIECVKVNGNVIEPENNVYNASFENLTDLSVSYNVYGLKTLTTTYPADLVNSLPDSSFSHITDINADEDDERFDIYNLQGLRMRSNVNSDCIKDLPAGIYIKANAKKVEKIIVE